MFFFKEGSICNRKLGEILQCTCERGDRRSLCCLPLRNSGGLVSNAQDSLVWWHVATVASEEIPVWKLISSWEVSSIAIRSRSITSVLVESCLFRRDPSVYDLSLQCTTFIALV